jgi:hypothetical protein
MSKYAISYITIPVSSSSNIRQCLWPNDLPMLIYVFAQIGLVKDDVELKERERLQ